MSGPFAGQVAVVTGASSGIGRALALGLAAGGAALCLVGRREEALADVARGAGEAVPAPRLFMADLGVDTAMEALAERLRRELPRVDLLVHSAGVIALGATEAAAPADLDLQYRVNVRAPYVLTRALLPALRASRGQVVYVNSSAGLAARAGVGQYAACKHALKALADSLREEVNGAGVRVLSLYPGRTASPMQASVHAAERKAYHPERLLQPEDVARAALTALCLPRTAEITDLQIRPMLKST